jgi:hypothetical protein
MALNIGSVVVDATGNETTIDGEVGQLYVLLRDDMLAGLAAQGVVLSGTDLQAAKQAIASKATLFATWAVNMLTLRAKAQVPGTLAGLQKTPTPNNPGVPTAGHGQPMPVQLDIA